VLLTGCATQTIGGAPPTRPRHAAPVATADPLTARPVAEATEGAMSLPAHVVPAQLLDGDEIVILAIKPSLWFVIFVSFRWLVAMGLLVAGAIWLIPQPTWQAITIQAAVGVAAVRLIVGLLQWASRLYILTDRRVRLIRGVFNVRVFECSLVRIQHTELRLAIHERLLRLGSIWFTTAGTGLVDAVWLHLARPLEVHERVREAINRAKRGRANGLR